MTDYRYLVVDRRNLFYWMSRGLIVPRSLMEKYRPDALDATPNALPVTSEAAAGPLIGPAEYPVCVELAPQVAVVSKAAADATTIRARGALSVRRVARVHVPTSGDADEIRAREYRGFDAGKLDIVVTPALFEARDAGADQPDVATGNGKSPDDRNLKRREAVAGAVMSMFSGHTNALNFPIEWLTNNETEDPVRSLVLTVKSSGLISRPDDVELLQATLAAIYDQSEQGDIVASTLLAQVAASVADSQVAGVNKHLERILELTRGADELKPFRGHGGLLTTKALLLYLLRPDPEAVRSWSDEDLNAETEVLQLSRLLAGFASRYSGLPSSLRGGASADALLDWTARGVQPSDFVISAEPTQDLEAAASPAIDLLRNELLAGKHDQALAVAHALGWTDCLQLRVTADSFEASTTDGHVHVTFAAGAELTWSLSSGPFIARLSGLSDGDLAATLKPKRSPGRRAPTKTTRGTAARSVNKTNKKAEEPSGPPANEEGSVGPAGLG
jgi:hypothetical protein